MSLLKKLFGQEPPPVAAPAAEPTEQQKSKAEFHRDRFARAIPECRAAVARGEKTPERLAELERWHRYYSALAEAEAAMPGSNAPGDATPAEEEAI